MVTLGLAALTALLSALLAIDEDESWYRNVVRRQARRRGDRVETDVPGVIFLEIDGLAHDVLRRAMRDGNAPTLARWLREGTPPPRRLGDRLVVADRRLPGGPAARRQPRHARLPLVGEGPRRGRS